MTDFPAVQNPLDPNEAPIYDSVLCLRDKLTLLKQDKSTYIKSQDVLVLYNAVIEQVHRLNTIREVNGKPLEFDRGLRFNYSNPTYVSRHRLTTLQHMKSGQHFGRLFPIDLIVLFDHRT